MGTVFIHIGVSKTATTTLQQNVFERLDGVSFLGKPGPHERDRTVDGFSKPKAVLLERTIKNMIMGQICPRDDIRTLRSTIEALKSSSASVIYSNELLCENKRISFTDIAAGLNEIFGPSEALVTIRDPQTALPSAYLHELIRFPDRRLCFTKWLDDAIANPRRINRPAESLEQYRYAFMLRQFAPTFGGRINVLRYEDLVNNRSVFSPTVARLTGADPETIEALLDLTPKNQAKSGLFYQYRWLVNKICSAFPLVDLRCLSVARNLNAAIEKLTETLPKKTVAVSEYDRARISHFFPYPLDGRNWREV